MDDTNSKPNKTSRSKFRSTLENLQLQFRQVFKMCTGHGERIRQRQSSQPIRKSSAVDRSKFKFLPSCPRSWSKAKLIKLRKSTTTEAICIHTNHSSSEDHQQSSNNNRNSHNNKAEKSPSGTEINGKNCDVGVGITLPFNEMILPSPPPTPNQLSHPDGDFFTQVIPPPLEYQDKNTPVITREPSPVNFNSGDGGYELCLEDSPTSDDVSLSCDNVRFHSLSSLKAPTNGMSTLPMTRPHDLISPIKSRGGFTLHDSISCNDKGICRSNLMTMRDILLQRSENEITMNKVCISWKDLPKSISLTINSGYVKSMFIPSWNNQPLRKAPFFSTLNKVVNWAAIDVRKERVSLKKQKQTDARRKNLEQSQKIWSCRHQIGLMKRKFKMGTTSEARFMDDFSATYQFIQHLNVAGGDAQSVGRYLDVKEKRLVAIKVFPSYSSSSGSLLDFLMKKLGALKEISALKQLEHANVIQFLTYFECQEQIHTVLEVCDHSLRCEITCAGKRVDPKMAHSVIHQILSGLDHCHRKALLHRNLSPDSILVTIDGVIKLADFTKAISLKGQRNPCLPGDIKYGPPELLALDTTYGLSADVWSVGVILVELIVGRIIWDADSPPEQLLLIHRSVGPLLRRHMETAGISEGEAFAGQSLREYFSDDAEEAYSLVELCFEVDPCKRVSCRGLLEHPFVKKGGQQPKSDAFSPRMALWDVRPVTAPSHHNCVAHLSSSSPLTSHHHHQSGEVPECGGSMFSSEELSPRPPPLRPILRTKTAVQKKPEITFAPEPSKEMDDGPSFPITSLPQTEMVVIDHPVVRDQLCGLGTKYFWRNLNTLANLQKKTTYTTSPDSSSVPILRKGHEIRKTEMKKSMEHISNADLAGGCTSCDCDEISVHIQNFAGSPRGRIQFLINNLPTATWGNVHIFTDHLKLAAKKNPKTFAAHVAQLTTVLLDQISDSKTKVAGPAVRILNTMCEYKGALFESEADRIIEQMLNKLGGPSFIEKEGNEVLRHLIRSMRPGKAILSVIKYGLRHKVSASRQAAILLVEELVGKLDLVSSFGLPGEQTPAQRRLATAVFDIATRLMRDSNATTRLAAKEIYQNLMHHPGFWYLYQSVVAEEKRRWVNRLLDEIRRFPLTSEKRSHIINKTRTQI